MIRVEDVSKLFGPVHALDGVTFEVGDHQILGFLGPERRRQEHGDEDHHHLSRAQSGRVTVDGVDVPRHPLAVRRKIGYLPENVPLYVDMSVHDYLEFCGKARGLEAGTLRERFDWVVDACGIGGVLKKTINELSKGYQQRTGLAQALIHDPEILILDEPTTGLDPLQIIGIRELIQELSRTKTIIFSTHILQEVSAGTDRVVIINEGRIIADGCIGDLRTRPPG